MLVREAAVYIVVLMLPLAFASLAWPARRVWAVRAVEMLVALIFSKFAIVAVLALGGTALGHAGGAATMLTGLTLVMMAAFAPWALVRLLPLTELASSAAGQLGGAFTRANSTYGRVDEGLGRAENWAGTLTAGMRRQADIAAASGSGGAGGSTGGAEEGPPSGARAELEKVASSSGSGSGGLEAPGGAAEPGGADAAVVEGAEGPTADGEVVADTRGMPAEQPGTPMSGAKAAPGGGTAEAPPGRVGAPGGGTAEAPPGRVPPPGGGAAEAPPGAPATDVVATGAAAAPSDGQTPGDDRSTGDERSTGAWEGLQRPWRMPILGPDIAHGDAFWDPPDETHDVGLADDRRPTEPASESERPPGDGPGPLPPPAEPGEGRL
jgi:hypothetical protein